MNRSRDPRERLTLLAYTVVGGLLVWWIWSAFSGRSTELIMDERYYTAYGVHVARGQGLYADQYFGRFYSYRGPGYPLWIALHVWLASNPLNALRTSQVFLHLLNARLVRSIATPFTGRHSARVAELLVLLNPALWRTTLHVIPMTLAITIWLLLILMWTRRSDRPGTAVICGILGAAGWLTRADFVVLFAAVMIATWWRRPGGRTFVLIASATCVLGMSPWIARNWTLHGQFLLFSSAGKQIGDGNYHGAPGDQLHRFLYDRFDPVYERVQRERLIPFDEVEWNRRLLRHAWHEVTDHPGEAFVRSLRKLGYTWNTDLFEAVWVRALAHPALAGIPCGLLLVLGGAGALATLLLFILFLGTARTALRSDDLSAAVSVAGLAISAAAMIGVGQPRYLLPVIALMPVPVLIVWRTRRRLPVRDTAIAALLLTTTWGTLNPWSMLNDGCSVRQTPHHQTAALKAPSPDASAEAPSRHRAASTVSPETR